jgi:hypothetical protein
MYFVSTKSEVHAAMLSTLLLLLALTDSMEQSPS